MKTAITIWVLTMENTEGLGVTVDTFADYESAKKKMEEIVLRFVDYDKECNVWGTDVFRAIVQRDCTSHINIHPQTVEIEVPYPEQVHQMWLLEFSSELSSGILGLYRTQKDAYKAMCEAFKYECNRNIGSMPIEAGIDEKRAFIEIDNGEFMEWDVRPITPEGGGAA